MQNTALSQDKPSGPSISREKIKIPKKIVRDQHAILQDLASSVKKDYNGPEYKYIDDPFLIPRTLTEKRAFTLSKASGQKAAQYVMKNLPEFFQKTPMWNFEDKLPKVYDVSMGAANPDDTIAGLQERIDMRLTIAAYNSYVKLKDAGTEISQELKQELLDLLCFYNSADPPEELREEEQFFLVAQGQDKTRKVVKTWKDKGLAEELFKEMEPTAAAYSSLIKGMAKYFQVHRANQLFEEMKQLNLSVDLSTYNAILSIAAYLNDGPEVRWEHQQSLLREMQAAGLRPDVTTFNNILLVLTRAANSRGCPGWMMAAVNEMKRLGLEPSLASWSLMMRVVYRDRDCRSPLLNEIIDYLFTMDNISLQSPEDLSFFSQAMSVACHNLQDLELAHKIDALVNKDDNMYLLGDGFKQGNYYSEYMQLVCLLEPFDKAIELYERITPHAYTPTFTAMREMINAMDLNDGFHYISKLWADLHMFYPKRSDLIEQILSTMAKKKHGADTQSVLLAIATQILELYHREKTDFGSLNGILSGKALGDLILIFQNSDDFNKAWEVYKDYNAAKRDIPEFPSEASLLSLAETCISNEELDKTLRVLASMADFAYPKLETLAEQVREKFKLTKEQDLYIEDLLE